MKARSFSHTGITVSDFNKAVQFYWEVFGCPLVGVADAPPERVRGFFGVDVPGATCKIGWIRIPGGAVIEIFHFELDRGSAPDPSSVARGGPAHPRGPNEFELDRSHGHAPLRSLAGAPCAPSQPAIAVPWSRVGMTHICFNVRGIQKWYEYLVTKGVEIVSKPEQSPRGHWLFFVRDFDGNLIEITDLGYMYHVLGWLGPLGGWLFRRGMYKRYYGTPWK